MGTNLLDTTVTPEAVSGTTIYDSTRGSIGQSSFFYRAFTYRIDTLNARRVTSSQARLCLKFAWPYEHGFSHRVGLQNLSLVVGSEEYRFPSAFQEAGERLCWYESGTVNDLLPADVASTLRFTTTETAPVVSVVSQPRNGDTYLAGEVLRFRLSTPEAVNVVGVATLGVTIGGDVVRARAVRSWSRSLVEFVHTVAADDLDGNGVSVSANSSEAAQVVLQEGEAFRTALGSRPFLEFAGLSNQAGHKVNGSTADVTPPTLEGATAQYREIWLDYNEALATSRFPSPSDYVVMVNGTVATVRSVVFSSDRRVLLALAAKLTAGDSVVLSSTATIRDVAGNTEAPPPSNLTVTNHTPTTQPTLSLSVTEARVREGDPLGLTVTLSQTVAHDVPVWLGYSPRVALTEAPVNVIVPAGTTELVVPLVLRHRESSTSDTAITVAAGQSEFYSGTPSVAVVSVDRDAHFTFHIIPAITLAATSEQDGPVSVGVDYELSAIGPAETPPPPLRLAVLTRSETAKLIQDYVHIARNVVVPSEDYTYSSVSKRWKARLQVAVQILSDEIPEEEESFVLELRPSPGQAGSINYCGSGARRRCETRITIGPNDFEIAVGIEATGGGSGATAAENGGRIELYFVAELPPEIPKGPAMEFNIEAVDGAAGLSSDYEISGSTGATTKVQVDRSDWFSVMEGGAAHLEVRKPIRFDIIDDSIDEDEEDFTVHLREPVSEVSPGIERTTGKQAVKVAIEDDDERGVVVSPTLVTLRPEETGTYSVNLVSQPTGSVTITLDGPDHEALEASPASLTFNGETWKTPQAVSVEAAAGFTVPAEDSIAHSVTGADYEGLEAEDTTVRAVSEAAQSLPGIAIADASADEDDGTVAFEVTLGASSTEEVTVRYRTQEGTAEEGEDYTAASGTLTFAAGDQSGTIQVSLVDDSSDEETERFQVILSHPVNAEISDAAASGQIADDDGAPTVTVAGGAASEADGRLRFTVTLSAPSSFEVTVGYETVEVPGDQGGATESSDFTATADTLTIAPGTKRVGIDVSLVDDSLHEEDETFGLTLSQPTNALLGANQSSGTGTIRDDDDPPTLTVTGGTASESAGSIAFDFELSAASEVLVTVPYESQGDSATDGVDYASSSGSLTIDPGQTRGVVRVPVYRDILVEPDETFGLLVDADEVDGANYASGSSDPVGTILDSPGPGLEIGDAVATEGSGTISFPVRILGAAASGVTVDWATRDGTAVAGADYTAANGSLTIAAGTGRTNVVVALIEDLTVEDDETFSVVLSNASGAALIDATAAGTITEDPLPVVGLAAATASEGASELSFVVSLNETATHEIRVNYQTSDVTATEDEDYLESAGVLTFGPGDTTKAVAVPIVADDLDETDETLALTLSGVHNATLGANPGIGTIQDDDAAPIISIADAEATEGGVVTFAVSLSAASGKRVTVGYATVAGTATAGDDYVAAEGTLTFDSEVTSRQVRVSLQQDLRHEPSETFTVELRRPVNSTVSESDGSATGTIFDDDVRAVVVEPLRLTVAEGGESSYTVRLATMPTASVNVGIAVSGNTDVSTEPSSLVFTTANWDTAQTVKVSAATDQNRESETATIGHTVGGGGYAGVAAESVAVEVTDGDSASTVVALRVDPESVLENGGRRTVAVKGVLNGAALSEATIVTVTVQGGTATVTDDFASVSAFTLTIPAESIEGAATFVLTPVDDDVDEAENETVAVSGTTTTEGLTVQAAELAIVDDDERGVVVQPTLLTVAEGSTGQYSVVLESEPTGSVTVSMTKSGSTDVTVPGTALSFTDSTWDTAQTVTVTASDDADSANDRATVAHTVTGGDYAGESADSVDVTVADDGRTATAITLSAIPGAVGEGDGATTVRVTAALDGAARSQATAVEIQVGATADAAAEGADYQTVSNFTLTIAADTVSGTATFSLTPVNDQVAEGNEAISVVGTTTVQGLTVAGTTVTLTDDDTASGGIVLSVNPGSVSEGDSATTMTVTATLDDAARTAATEVTVTVGAATDSATETSDYQAVPGFTLTIPSGMRAGTGTFMLTPVDDSLGESAERISVSGSASGLSVTGTGVTLNDNEMVSTAVTLQATPASVGEDDAATMVTVTATLDDAVRPEVTTVTVSVGAGRDSATEGTDYATVADFSLTIPASTASGTATFTLTPTQDTLGEGEESISVDGAAVGLTVAGTAVALADDETVSQTIALSAAPASVSEDATATQVTVTATLNGAARTVATPVTVSVGASGDSATEGTDYRVVGGFTITIPAAMTSATGTFTLTPRDDDLAEGDELLSLEGTTTAVGLTVTGADVTISDDESTPTSVALSATPPSLRENGGQQSAILTATLDGGARAVETDVTVVVGDSSDSATEGVDYGVVAGFQVTIPAGSRQGTAIFQLLPTEDLLYEGSEEISVEGTSSPLDVTGTSLTLIDDERESGVVTLSASPTDVAEGAGATQVTVTARLNGGARGEDTPVEIEVGASGDGAKEGEDYATVAAFTITITGGEISNTGTFQLTPTQDSVYEPDESLSVSGTTSATGLSVSGTEVGITDDETVGVTVSPTSLTIEEGDDDKYTVVLTSQPSADVTVTVTAPGNSGVTVNETSLTFTDATWATAQTVTVTAVEDADAVAPAAVTIGHSATGGGYDSVSVASVAVTVTEDDTAGVTVSPTSLTIEEGDDDKYTVVLTSKPSADVTVAVTAPGNSGVTVNETSLTFTDTTWAAAQTVTVTAAEDDDAVAPAAVTIGHSATGGGYDSVSVDGVVVTVTEDDTAGVTVSPTSLTIEEGDDDEYTVVLTSKPSADVTVTVTAPGNSGVTVNETSLTFTDTTWATAQTVTVTAVEDADAVAPAAVTIGHSATGGGYDSVSVDGVVVTVTDDETVGVTVSPTSLTIEEGDDDKYTVVLTSQPSADVTVAVTAPSNSGVTVNETSLTFTDTTWATAQTVTVTAAEDDDAVAPAAVTIGHSATGGGYDSVSVDGVVVTVTEDDTAGVTVSPTSLTIEEGDNDEYTVVLTSKPSADVTVTVSVPTDSGVTVNETSLTFTDATWATAQTVTVTAVEDADAVAPAAVTIGHSATGGGYDSVSVASVAVTVTEDDTAGVTVSPTSLTIEEGDDDKYTVVLTSKPSADVTVAVTAPSNSGVTVNETSLTFTDTTWAAAQTVTVTAAEDDDAVAPAAVTIGHSATGGGYDSVSVDGVVVTVTEDDTVGVTVSPTSLTIEEGDDDKYTVVLTSQPSADVTVTVTAPGNSGVTVNETSLTFTDTTWATAQTVTVTAVEDADAVAPAAVTIGHSATGGGYDSVSVDGVVVTVTDDETVGVTVSPTSLTIEEGDDDKYTVVLTSQPSADVTVAVTAPSNSGVTVNETSLTFTDTTWAAAQTVTVTAAEDDDAVAPAAVTIGHSATGGGYDSVSVDGVVVTVTEDDTAGVTVSPTSLTIEEGDDNEYTVVLTSKPSADVTVTVSVPTDSGVTVNETSLTFTDATWATAQTVTVTAVEDADAVAPAAVTIGHSAAGGDYDGVSVASVVVTVTDDETVGVTVSPTSLTIEEGDNDEYTVVLTSKPSADVTVTVTAPGNSGVTVDETSLTFTDATWATAQTVTVTAVEDADAVAPAAVTIGHSATGGGYDSVSVDGVVVTVTEDDTAGVTVSPTSLTIEEGDNDEYTVVLTSKPSADVTVTVTAPGNSGVTVNETSLTFTDTTWATAQTVTVTAVEDADAVAPAAVTIGHSAAGGDYDGVSVASVVVTVTDDETVGVTVSPTSLTIEEGDNDEYTVVLTSKPSADVTVTVTAPGNSGVTVDETSLTFTDATWATAQTVTVTAVEDADAVAPAAVTIGHSATGGGYDSVSVDGVVVTVTEDDTAGVTVSPTSLTIEEGDNDEYTVVLTSQPSADVTVTVTAPGNSGVTVNETSLTFTDATWATAQTVTVTAVEDADAVAPAAVTIGHSATGGGYNSVSVASVVVTVTDDETVGVTVSPTSLTIEEGDNDEYTVVLTSKPSADVTVTVTAPGNSGVTVDETSLTFTDATWATAQTVTVTAVEDDDAVAPAAVTIGHSATGGGYDSVSVDGVVVTVTEDDTAGVTVSPTSLTIEEGDDDEYTVVLTSKPSADVTVTVTAPGNSGVTVDETSLTFTDTTWATAQTVTVTAVEDADAVAPAAVTIGHSAAGGDYDGVSVASVVVTVTDDETVGVTVSPTSLTIEEGDNDEYTVVLTSKPSADVTVTVTAPGNSGVTVDETSLTFTDATWATAQTVTVTAVEDADAVAPAAVTIGHSATGGGYDSVSVDGVVVTVTEDDTAGVTVSPTSLTIEEGDNDEYTVVLTSQPSADVTVTVSVPTDSGVTVNETSLTFTDTTWATAQTVTVTAVEDADAVAPAAVTIGHSAAGGDYDSVSVDGVAVTVTEDDTVGVTVTPTSLTIEEGDDDEYTVVLTSKPSADVTVTVSVPTDSGVTVNETSLTFTDTTWATAQTVTVEAAEDDDAVAPAAVTIGHSATGGGYDSVSVDGVVVTVTEDDTAGVTVSPTSLTIEEGDDDEYTVVLTSKPSADVTVTVSVPTDSGVTVNETSLTFTDTTWATAQTVTVTAVEDADAVAPAAVTIGHSATGGGYDSVSVASVVVTVTDDETVGVTVSPTSLTIVEGDDNEYTVVLTSKPSADVTVTVSVPTDSGVTVNETSLTFTDTTWATAQTVTVEAAEDDDAVAPAAVTIGHSATGGGYDSVSVDGVAVTVTEDDTVGVTVTPTSLTIEEGDDDEYTVVLTSKPSADVTVTVSVPTDSGVTVNETSLTFTDTTWATPQTVTVTAVEDDLAVALAAVTIGHSATGGDYGSVSVDSVVVTATNNDTVTDNATVGVTVTPTALTVAEGGDGTYTIVLTSQPSADVTVTVTVPGNSGVTVDVTSLTFTDTTWATAQTVTVTAAEDDVPVVPAAVTIGHSAAGGGYDSVAVDGVVVTVTDNDTTSQSGTVALSVVPTTVDEGASATPVTVTATLGGGVLGAATPVLVEVGLSGDGATEGVDYTEVGGFTITIAANTPSNTATFTLTPTQDALDEGAETLSVAGTTSVVGLTVTPVEVTIQDDSSTSRAAPPPPPVLPELTIAPGPSPVTEGSEVEFTVTRSHAQTELAAVEVQISETGSVLGRDPSVEVGFSAGELTAVLSLPTIDDHLDEPNSVVRAALTAGDGHALGEEATATVRVTDNDATPELTIEPLVVSESAGVAEFAARLSGASARPLSLNWATSDGAAIAGRDYRAASGTMAFAPGDKEKRFLVELIDDRVAEPSEDFTIVLDDVQMVAKQRSTRATIVDDDAPPTAISLALDRERVSEGGGATTVGVTATLIGGVWAEPIVVEVAVAGGGDEEAVDFSPVSGFEILIPATESSGAAAFILIPEDDRIDERNETVEVSGTSSLPVSPTSAILEDDDVASRSIRLTLDRERISEGAGPTVVTVTATLDRSARAQDTPVRIVLSDSGLPEAVDYNAVTEFDLTIPKDQLSGSVQFTLIPEDDRVDERDERIQATGSSVLPVSPASLLLEDDDSGSQTIVLSLDHEVIPETAGPTQVAVTATLDRSARTEDTLVRIEVLGSGTRGAVRFAPVDTFDLTIRAEEPSGVGAFTLTPLVSVLKSLPETVEVSGSSDLPVVPSAVLLVDVATGEVPAGWLERFARTVASQTVDLVRERLDGRVGAGNQLSLFGYRLFGGYGGRLGGLSGGPVLSGYGQYGSAGPAGLVRAGPLPVGASVGGGGLGGQGPFGHSGYGGGVSLMGGQVGGGSMGGALGVSGSLGQLATWGNRAPTFSLSRYPSDQRRDLLARSSFTFSSADGSGNASEDAGIWMVWGRGAKTNFRGREANASLVGDVVTGTVGVDYERGDVLAGVAISRTSGQGRMETVAVADVDASLTTGLPYLRVEVGEKLTLWGVLGYGEGQWGVTENDFVTETDISMAMVAAGARRDLAFWVSGLRLRLNSDAFLTRVKSEAVLGLDAVNADVNRLRLALEGSYARSFASGSVLTPSVELGVRYDGGAADTGYGVELGAAVRYADTGRGLTAEVSARSLLTHEASAFEEWGASGSLAVDPGPSGLGPAFRIRSSWGVSSGGVQQLWSQEQMFDLPGRSSFEQGGRAEAEAGYGFGRRLGRYRVMPYGVLMGAEQGERGFGMGVRLDLGATFSLTLEASRRERFRSAAEGAARSGDDAAVIRGVWRLPPRRQPLPGFADDPAAASFTPCPVEEQVSDTGKQAMGSPSDDDDELPDSFSPDATCVEGR